MAKVLVTEDYLSDIADAIREKKASEDTYTPAEMADAIESIQTGTAPTGTIGISTNGTHDVADYAYANVSVPTGTARSSSDLTAINLTVTAPAGLYASDATKTLSDANLVAGNIKKDVTIFGTTGTYEGSGGDYVAADWFDYDKPVGDITTSLSGGNGYSYSNIMAGRQKIGKVTAPNLTGGASMFANSSITELVAPNLGTLGSDMFNGCTKLTRAVFPKGKVTGTNNVFKGCTSLTVVDLGGEGGNVYLNMFLNCSLLKTLILRTSTLASLSGTANFNGSPFASDGTGGTLYVPSALVSAYQSASNWSTILGYANNQIKSIENSIYENQYADGTPISS